jgi:hypothetical protein
MSDDWKVIYAVPTGDATSLSRSKEAALIQASHDYLHHPDVHILGPSGQQIGGEYIRAWRRDNQKIWLGP